jgi:hypothetical protein
MIYIDMDDVVADFSGYVNQKCGTDLKVGHGMVPIEHWRHLCQYHPRMFRNLEPNLEFINDGYELIRDKFNDSKIAFLTALPVDGRWDWRYAAQDKVDWIRSYFGNKHPVFFGPYTFDKYRFCKSSNDILIDDREDICNDWSNNGGIAILYRNNKQFVQNFKEL